MFLTSLWIGLCLITACGEQPSPVPAVPGPLTTTVPAIPSIPVPPKPDIKKIQAQLDEAWTNYTNRFIQQDGRVVDPAGGGITTSEGQSYALLRGVWQNDRPVFDKTLQWSQQNLQIRPTDKLFSYKWGKSEVGTWQILDPAVASDADSDIALALIFAAKRWNEPNYNRLALEILNALWDKTVILVNNKPYLTAGDWAPTQSQPSLNPSYLSPYAYRVFAKTDPAHNWFGLVETSYQVIRGCTEANLDGLNSAKLPPNWCGLNPTTGQFTLPLEYPRMNLDYGYDAFRVYWRVALDYKWYGEKKALDFLTWSDTLRLKWKQDGKLAKVFDHSGKPLNDQEALSNYAGALSNFLFTEPLLADNLVLQKYIPAYQVLPNEPGGVNSGRFAGWGESQDYYNQNWVWFGLALFSGRLPNLAA